MDFKINLFGIACVFLILSPLVIAQHGGRAIVNQLTDELFQLKENVDNLSHGVKTLNDNIYLAEEKGDGLCHSVTDKFSSTLRHYIDSQVVLKLDTTHKEQDKRLENLEEKLNVQTSKLDKFGETQMQILQQISDKLNKNQELLQKYERELLNVVKSRPKLSKKIILGLSTSNVASIN